jgi:hypothetical protein
MSNTGRCFNVGGYDPDGFSRVFNRVGGDTSTSCASTSGYDPANLCSGTLATDSSGAQGVIDKLADSPLRYDYLFVVSPTNITRAMMDESSTDPAHNIYTPVRYQLLDDCKANDPTTAAAGDCLAKNLIRYKLKKHGVGFAGNDNDGAGDYPLCVLQKDP